MRAAFGFILASCLWLFSTASVAQIRVVVWDEQQPAQKQAYENFLGNFIASQLKDLPGLSVKSVNLNEKEQGLSKEMLDHCDVLIWWGHLRHNAVPEATARDIVERLKEGRLSLIFLHSSLDSRPFNLAMEERARADVLKSLDEPDRKSAVLTVVRPPRRPVKAGEKPTPYSQINKAPDGTIQIKLTLPTCVIAGWREEGKPSHATVLAPQHPIVSGLGARFDLPHTEMYNEPWEVPAPDLVLLEERWDSGEHFRSACLWQVGKGKVFYFRPGHETYAVYKEKPAMQIIENAVRWLGERK